MIVQILAHTPIWVYPLFLLLLVFGFIQTRTRTVRRVPALLLPAGMSVLSLAGIISSFGLTTLPLAAWGLAIAIATVVGYTFFRDTRVHSNATDGTFFIPGSWVPLVVMMAIFFTKYLYAIMNAYNPEIYSTPLFIGTLSAVYGLYSGYFSSRTVTLEAGVLFGAVYMATRSLWVAMGLHTAWNFLQGDVFGVAVSGNGVADSLFTPLIQGNPWLTGGAFGIEASVISVVLGLGVGIYVLVQAVRQNRIMRGLWWRGGINLLSNGS